MAESRFKWLIGQWFLWAHEWLFYINKPLHYKYMSPLCYAYDQFIAPWVYGEK